MCIRDSLYGPQTGMYCVLGLIGRSTIVDTAIESLNLRKVCTCLLYTSLSFLAVMNFARPGGQ